jgi:hypothetical protein
MNNAILQCPSNSPRTRHSTCDLARIEAVLGVYELNKVYLLKGVFIWAYDRSAACYAADRKSLGEPDPFRLRYRDQNLTLIAHIVRMRVGHKGAAPRITRWSQQAIDPEGRKRFVEIVESEHNSLQEGNFARNEIHPSAFAAWRLAWEAI